MMIKDTINSMYRGTGFCPKGEPALKLQDVCKSFRSGDQAVDVLRGISFEVASEESVAITGVSGSGKTTLLNIIGGIERPSTGTIEVCGYRLNELSSKQQTTFRREKVGFIFQFFNLFPTLTAQENVMVGMEATGMAYLEAYKRAIKYLEAVGLKAHSERFPHQLSGGEQQRVAIARALAKEPPLILADEPTGNLDQNTGKMIFELLNLLQGQLKATMIIVTHNPSISNYVDLTFLLNNGLLEKLNL